MGKILYALIATAIRYLEVWNRLLKRINKGICRTSQYHTHTPKIRKFLDPFWNIRIDNILDHGYQKNAEE